MGRLDPRKIWENGVNGREKERIEKQCGNIRVRIAKTGTLDAMDSVRNTRQQGKRMKKRKRER